jgi:CRISPR/Cas system-associated exonuclease Cas4 (RecB family)
LLLEKSQQKPIANYSYIYFPGAALKVNLLNKREVIALYDRYWQIIEGQVKPCMMAENFFCKRCSYQQIGS